MSTTEVEKTCKRCGASAPLAQFYRDLRFAGGVDIQCSECRKNKTNSWRAKNAERAREISRKSRLKHADKARARAKLWHAKNRDRHLAYMANRRATQPRKVWEAKIKSSFGITARDYSILLLQQNFCCAICGKDQTEFKKRFAVDHCHDTGIVRGLLCANCNKGIGNLQESIAVLQSAINYIKSHEQFTSKNN